MIDPVFNFRGIADKTIRIAVTDVAQQFTAAQYSQNNHPAIAAFITCEDNGVRYCFGGETPTQGAAGLGHVFPKDSSIYLNNPQLIQTFSFINETNASDAILQITFEYEVGAL